MMKRSLGTHLDLVIKVSGESVYSVSLSHCLVATGRGPGFHPVYKTPSPTVWPRSVGTMV